MEDLIKEEIIKIQVQSQTSIEESVVIFCSLLAGLYFKRKLGLLHEDKINKLVYEQTRVDIHKFDLNDSLLQKEALELLDREDVDLIGRVYNKLINGDLKKLFGRFYTPAPLVEHLLDSVCLEDNKDCTIIDISCGAGIFLAASIRRLIKLNHNLDKKSLLKKLTKQINGVDIDEFACRLTKLNLLITTFPVWKDLLINKTLDFSFNIKNGNSLELFSRPIFNEKFDLVIGNPPYVESKKLQVGIKKICRKIYPDIAKGAFDLYIFFIDIALSLLSSNGYLGFVLPNKFQVVKFAQHVRKNIIDNFNLSEICDISNLKYFDKTDVYPILLTVQNNKNNKYANVVSNIPNKSKFENNEYEFIKVNQHFYERFNKNFPFFTFESKIDQRIFTNIINTRFPRLGDYLDIKTTVSFHAKGMRERFIKQKIESRFSYPYLGGKSFSRKNEVGAFRVDWQKYYINYDVEALKKESNPMPPLSNFFREKIIFCQHAKRLLAYADISGKWVTKDVFPIAFLKEDNNKINRTYYYAGYLNSNIFSFLYGIVYKGIQISEGYFHFLPSYMAVIPSPNENTQLVLRVSALVREIQKRRGKDKKRISQMNQEFYAAFGLLDKQVDRIEEYNEKYFLKKNASRVYNLVVA